MTPPVSSFVFDELEELEETSTHKSAKTFSGPFFVRDLNLRSFDQKIYGFTGFIVGHLYVKFGYPSYIGFVAIVRINGGETLLPRPPSEWVVTVLSFTEQRNQICSVQLTARSECPPTLLAGPASGLLISKYCPYCNSYWT